jgi:tRNA (guanine37-N1)-methyltransferase
MHGEALRMKAMYYGLLDLTRKPKASRSNILLPINRFPLEEESATLGKIAEFEIVSCVLPKARPTPKSLAELVTPAVPTELAIGLPKSFDIIGDIVVIEELSKTLMDYKEAIGEALLKLNPNAKTCLLKIGKVEGERRVPVYQVIAGLKKTTTVFVEYGVKLKIDLAKVYFSPRLGFERQRVAAMVSEGETVVDMFAGVGPFSIAIAKKASATVYAIDINPDAIELLKTNISLNRLKGTVLPICGDAALVSREIKGVADHVVMNLPGSSLSFVKAALLLLKPTGGILHIYVFSPDPVVAHTTERVKEALKEGCRLTEIKGMRVVKEVAPRKWQIAVDVACLGRV